MCWLNRKGCLIESGGDVKRRMRRPAWQHMMDLPKDGLTSRHTSPGSEWMGQTGRLRRKRERVSESSACACTTHSRHMAALYDIEFTA